MGYQNSVQAVGVPVETKVSNLANDINQFHIDTAGGVQNLLK